jgi:hypothetical protein
MLAKYGGRLAFDRVMNNIWSVDNKELYLIV